MNTDISSYTRRLSNTESKNYQIKSRTKYRVNLCCRINNNDMDFPMRTMIMIIVIMAVMVAIIIMVCIKIILRLRLNIISHI